MLGFPGLGMCRSGPNFGLFCRNGRLAISFGLLGFAGRALGGNAVNQSWTAGPQMVRKLSKEPTS